MTDYPQWLKDRVAKALYEAPSVVDGLDDGSTWPPSHPTDRAWWDERATAALDELGFSIEGPGDIDDVWISQYQWDVGPEITP